MNFIIKETFIPPRDTEFFSPYKQAENADKQTNEYICSKLGSNYKSVEVYPHKRRKFICPICHANTYIWIENIYSNSDNQKQIHFAECAKPSCGEYFLIYLEIVSKYQK